MYETGEIGVKLIAAKARVCPISGKTIPKLELQGAHLMATFVESIKRVLVEELNVSDIDTYYWVDSAVTLCWIRNEKPWKPFVRNRVSQIRQITTKESWFFWPGNLNPADIPSRGDVVLLKNEQTKRCFWKMGKITELLPGKDGYVRAARLEIPTETGGKRVFTRSIKHLIPLELHVGKNIEESSNNEDMHLCKISELPQKDTQTLDRPRRNVAIIGELNRHYKVL
eukprot:gene14998-6151_t